ncbi:T9SS type A sorting domain-containing protein [bacterium]|nr:T9SS type A sorting domain-containing protein [bacterium]
MSIKRIIISLLLVVSLSLAVVVFFNRLPGGPPTTFEILVFNDGEPPVDITDFHFSVSPMPCQVTGATYPTGWTMRYALPNSFVELDAGDGSAIPAGSEGMFGVTIDGPCEGATFSFYLTGPDGVIPGSEREGPIEGLGIIETRTPSGLGLSVAPNPFNSACLIKSSANSLIEIYDIKGHILDSYSCGFSTTCWVWSPASNLGNGIYLVRATNGSNSTIKKVFYIK